MAKRGKTPSLITGSNGKPSVITVKKRRTCVRCSNKIESGDKCFEIPKVGGGFSNRKPYCCSCFKEVLGQTRRDLEELENQFQ